MRITVICAIIVLKTTFTEERGEDCLTPNGEEAKCIPAKECTVLIDALKQNETGIKEFAQKSQCGYDTDPLVCCGTTTYVIPLSRAYVIGVLPNRTVCGLDAFDKKIFNGDQTRPKEFPWVAALEYKNKLSGTNAGIKCGGSIITKRFVMTAAHCLSTTGLELISVWLGEWKISTDPDCESYASQNICHDPVQKLGIEKKIPHPYYNARNNTHDIALLRLVKDITYTDYIIPICLADPNSAKPNILTSMTVAGWGLTENGQTSDIKLKVEVPLLSNNVCSYKLKNFVGSTQLCVGGEGSKDSCKGDSGGPLMRYYRHPDSVTAQWYQEGIVSWGIGCARPDYPGVYTRVATYVYWIVKTISEPPGVATSQQLFYPSRRVTTSTENSKKVLDDEPVFYPSRPVTTSPENSKKVLDEIVSELFQ